ncbi:MAG: FHA domain-containing protein [Roseiflexus castenholzii]|uniref:FHA domain-containing protein n=1 Tax=Roseiflexus castenholzii TaxID=120962 RepID=UPI000CC6D86D|nr:MAG: FHA domain-containing protein [Roseiflexus castenholzii]
MNNSSGQQPDSARSDLPVQAGPGAARLVIRRDGVIERRMVLGEVVITVGRALSNDLVLSYEGVSRRHAEFHPCPEGVMVVDVGSANGTFVDGRRLAPHVPHLLRDSMFCSIGPYTITYHAPGSLSRIGALPTVPLPEAS